MNLHRKNTGSCRTIDCVGTYVPEAFINGPLARYVKLRVAHAPGMPGTFSSPPWVSDPGMRHGTCVTHVPWCMPGSLTIDFFLIRWRGKRSRHSRRMRNAQIYVSGKRSMAGSSYTPQIMWDVIISPCLRYLLLAHRPSCHINPQELAIWPQQKSTANPCVGIFNGIYCTINPQLIRIKLWFYTWFFTCELFINRSALMKRMVIYRE